MANYADLRCQGVEKYSSAALENQATITTVQSILLGFDGRNTDASNAIFVMVFDKATAAANGDTPIAVVAVPPAGSGASAANGNFGYNPPTYGIKFKLGIQIAASTTDAPTLTLSATTKTFFHVQFAREDGLSAV